MGRYKHRLVIPYAVICKCGKVHYPKNHKIKYCSDECRKKFIRNWGEIRREFNDANPHLCDICGCDNSGSRFKNCLGCREKFRIYNRNYKEKKAHEL